MKQCQGKLTSKATDKTVEGRSSGNEVNEYDIKCLKDRVPNHVKIQVNLVIMPLLTYSMGDTLNNKEVDITDNNS